MTSGGRLADLVQLLRILCTGRPADLDTFLGQKRSSLEGIDAEAIRHNLRLMALSALGTQKPNLHYREIAEALGVPEDDVEDWVVDAVGEGLIDAHMDQTNNTVAIR